MAKPPVFDSGTLERQQNLLAAEDRRLRSVEDWKGTFMAAGFIAALLGLVAAVGAIVLGLFR